MEAVELEKELTANQLYKIYKEEGGTLNFTQWLTREKTKGSFALDSQANEEIKQEVLTIRKKEDMKDTILGFPTKTLLITAGVIVAVVVITKLVKKSQQ